MQEVSARCPLEGPGRDVCGEEVHLAPDTHEVDNQVSRNSNHKGVGLLLLLAVAGQLPVNETFQD